MRIVVIVFKWLHRASEERCRILAVFKPYGGYRDYGKSSQ